MNEQDYLMHYGVKGMKWGVRRYQNPDGTLTEEGRRRYGKDIDTSKPAKRVRDMSDEELAGAVNRLRSEKAYKDLMGELYPEKVTLMDKVVSKLKNETIPNTISQVVQNTATSFVKQYADAKISDMVESKFGDKERLEAKRTAEIAKNLSEAAQNDWLTKAINEERAIYDKNGKWVGREPEKKLTSSERKKQRMTDALNDMNTEKYYQLAKLLQKGSLDPSSMKLWTDKAKEDNKSNDDKKKDKK